MLFWFASFDVFSYVFHVYVLKIINSPKLMEYVSVKPYLLSFGACLYGFCVKLAGENMS
jgi:hypothetical protein